MKLRAASPFWLWLAQALSLAAADFVTGALSLRLANPPGLAPTVWPPAGIALAGMLLFGYRVWPGIWLGTFLAIAVTFADGSSPGAALQTLAVAAGTGLGDVLQAAAGAWLVCRLLGKVPSLDRLREVLVLIVLAGVVGATALSATVGAAMIAAFADDPFWTSWWAGWRADAIGVLVFAPLVLALANVRPRARAALRPGRVVEAAVLLGGFLLYAFLLAGKVETHVGAILVTSFSLWAALRFGALGTAVGMLLLTALMAWNVKTGTDLLGAIRPGEGWRVLTAQTLLGFLGLIFWVLAAIQQDRRRILTDLRDNEARYRSLVEMAPDAVLILEDGCIRYCNPAGLALLGAPAPAALLGKPVREFLHPDDHAASAARIRTVLDTGQPVPPYHFRVRRLDGGPIDVESRAGPCVHRGGEAVQVVSREVTERMRAEAAVRASEARLRAVLETAPDFILNLDRQGKILFMNRVLPNYTIDQVIGTSGFDYVPPAHRDRVRVAVESVFRTGKPNQYETLGPSGPDGGRSWYLTRVGPVFHDREVVAVTLCATDITERNRAEEQLRASLREKEALLKEVHHRVKNNLQIISSLLRLQSEQLTDPAALAVLAESQDRVRAMALVHEALYHSENLAHIDLAPYLESLCAHLLRAYGTDPSRIQLDLRVAEATLDMDRAIPCGLLVNEMVSNALKYAFPDGRPGRLAVELAAPDGVYALTVGDDGVGLPEDLDYRHTRTLGLQLVCGLARQLGGAIELDRTGGTRFTITFAPGPRGTGGSQP